MKFLRWLPVALLASLFLVQGVLAEAYTVTAYTDVLGDITDTIVAVVPTIIAGAGVIFAGILGVRVGLRLIKGMAK